MRPNADESTVGQTSAATPPTNTPAPLPRFQVSNFTRADVIDVQALRHQSESDRVTPLVSLVSSAGSLRFQHDLTPAQARQMAAQLMLCADALERTEPLNGDTGIQLSDCLTVDNIDIGHGDSIKVIVPMFEAIGLEVSDLTGKAPSSDYIEIPLHCVNAVIEAMKQASIYASVDLPAGEQRGYLEGRAAQ